MVNLYTLFYLLLVVIILTVIATLAVKLYLVYIKKVDFGKASFIPSHSSSQSNESNVGLLSLVDQDDSSLDYSKTADSSLFLTIETRIFNIIRGLLPTLIWLIDFTIIFKCFFVFTIVRNEMKGTKVGGRFLSLSKTDKTFDGNLEMIWPFLWNTFLDTFSVGLWKALGLMHYFYLYRLDERICWGEIQDESFDGDSIVFRPNEDECDGHEQEFRIYSAYCGHEIELLEWAITLGSFRIVRFFAQPIAFIVPCIEVWRMKNRLKHTKYGGRGKFVTRRDYTNPNAEAIPGFPSSVMLTTDISYLDYSIRHLVCVYIGIFTWLIYTLFYGLRYLRQYKDSTIHLTNKK